MAFTILKTMLGRAKGSVLYQLKINNDGDENSYEFRQFRFVYSYLENSVITIRYGQKVYTLLYSRDQ